MNKTIDIVKLGNQQYLGYTEPKTSEVIITPLNKPMPDKDFTQLVHFANIVKNNPEYLIEEFSYETEIANFKKIPKQNLADILTVEQIKSLFNKKREIMLAKPTSKDHMQTLWQQYCDIEEIDTLFEKTYNQLIRQHISDIYSSNHLVNQARLLDNRTLEFSFLSHQTLANSTYLITQTLQKPDPKAILQVKNYQLNKIK